MKRSTLTGARLLLEDMQKGGFRHRVIMVTTTYAKEDDYEPRDISSLVKGIREWCGRRGVVPRYQWVMELMRSGRPHYHLLCFLPRHLTLPKPDKQGWWSKGMTRIEVAHHAVAYLAKYTSKGADGLFPSGARIHGCGGLSLAGRHERRWWLLPRYVRDVFALEARIEKIPGGGYLNLDTGQIVFSEWIFAGFGPGATLLFSRRDLCRSQSFSFRE